MPSKLTVRLATLAGFALAVVPALAQDRCTGTLCDLYYGSSVPEPDPNAPKPPPTPLTVPTLGALVGGAQQPAAPGAAPAPTPRIAIQGGGLLSALSGAPAERCTGTLCDFYYGGPPPETPTPVVGPAGGAEPGATEAGVAYAAPPPSREAIEAAQRRERPLCAATGRDPWACYR